jgi:hypothetical protein
MLVDFRRELGNAGKGRFAPGIMKQTLLPQSSFHQMICLEERRAERSRKGVLLMLLDVNGPAVGEKECFLLNRKMISVLSSIIRETDVTGWYKENSVVGLLFTEVATEEVNSVTAAIMNRVSKILKANLTSRQFADISLSFHLLPETEACDLFPLPVSSVDSDLATASSVSGSSL